MPSGATHDKIAVATSPILATATTGVLIWGLHTPPLEGLLGGLLLTASHLACTNWLSPDLDLGSSEIDERWGRLGFIWRPYERVVPHRHWMSHSGFSVLGRLLYLYLALNLILIGIGIFMLLQTLLIGLFIAGTPTGRAVAIWLVSEYVIISTAGFQALLTYPREALLVVIGAIFSDALHSVSDVISTSLKRRRHRRQRKATLHMPDLSQIPRRLHKVSLSQVRWLRGFERRPQQRKYRSAPRRARRHS